MEQFRIFLAVPGNGQLSEQAAQASWLCSLHHRIDRYRSNNSGPNLNTLWHQALNLGKRGIYSHFVMLFTDACLLEDEPGLRWGDKLVEEQVKVGVPYISCPTSIKDHRKVTSSGIGHPDSPWQPWRRFTTAELDHMPMTFTAADIGYGDKFLLHNQHVGIWDLRWPGWYQLDDHGDCPFVFNYTERISWESVPLPLEGGEYVLHRESEDWAFSRILWKWGVPSAITRRIKIHHPGVIDFENYGVGLHLEDEATAARWRDGTEPRWLPEPVAAGSHI